MNIRELNEALDRLLEGEITDELLSFSSYSDLLRSKGNFDDYLCEDPEKGFCITTITYEYEDPQINYQTDWYPTKEEAVQAYNKDLGEFGELILENLEPATFTDEEKKNLDAVVEVVKEKFGIDNVRGIGTHTQGTFEYDLDKDGKCVGLCEIVTDGIHIHMFNPKLDVIVKSAEEAKKVLK